MGKVLNKFLCVVCETEFFAFTPSHWCERCRRKVLRDIAEYNEKCNAKTITIGKYVYKESEDTE